jgi:hypothetical protein
MNWINDVGSYLINPIRSLTMTPFICEGVELHVRAALLLVEELVNAALSIPSP